jgi:PBP1b-binding outer membrane lipoprotein LpoB
MFKLHPYRMTGLIAVLVFALAFVGCSREEAPIADTEEEAPIADTEEVAPIADTEEEAPIADTEE